MGKELGEDVLGLAEADGRHSGVAIGKGRTNYPLHRKNNNYESLRLDAVLPHKPAWAAWLEATTTSR